MNDADSPGKTFFSRSLFRSGGFLFAIGTVVALIVGSLLFFLAFWSRMPLYVKLVLFGLVCWNPIRDMRTAILRHKELRRFYFQGEVHPDAIGVLYNPALDVAASAIIEGLIYSNTALLSLLFFLSLVLHRAK